MESSVGITSVQAKSNGRTLPERDILSPSSGGPSRPEDRMSLMAIVDILNEIDAYLVRLRHARALLARQKDALLQRERRSKSKTKVRKPAPSLANKPRIHETKSRSKPQVMASPPQVQSPVSQPSKAEGLPVMAPEPAAPQTLNGNMVPVQRLRASLRGVRRLSAKPAPSAEADKIKPAIALSGAVNRVVVVSPEQVQRERDRTATAANAEVRRPRMPSSGRSGRLAFEALFKDAIDPSKASGQ